MTIGTLRARRTGRIAVMVASAVVSTLLAMPASALTQIDFISDPDDYVGGEQRFSLTPADGTIFEGQGPGIQIYFQGSPSAVSPKTFWGITLAAPMGGTLMPGNYASAHRFQSARRPQLDVFGDGRGCNTVAGKFTVYEAQFDADGNVVAFAADAEQHCEGAPAALRLRIRINSSVPLQLHLPQAMPGWAQEVYERALVTLDGSQSYDPDGHIVSWHWSQIAGPAARIESPGVAITKLHAPDVAPGGADLVFRLDIDDDAGNHASGTSIVHVFDKRDRRSLLTWRSPPGDYIGAGMPLMFTAADGAITVDNAYQGQASVQASVAGADFDWWTLAFAAPDGAPLAPGIYTNAERFPFQSPGVAGLSVDGAGRGCNTLAGRFTILEIDTPFRPTQFGARFGQRCEGVMPELRGTILVNAIAPGDPIARIGGAKSAARGAIVTLDATGSSSSGSLIVAYKWRQLSGPPITIDDPASSRISFVAPSTSGGPTRFELEVDDEDGLVDVAQVDVAGLPTASVAIPAAGTPVVVLLAAAIGASGLMLMRRRRDRARP